MEVVEAFMALIANYHNVKMY